MEYKNLLNELMQHIPLVGDPAATAAVAATANHEKASTRRSVTLRHLQGAGPWTMTLGTGASMENKNTVESTHATHSIGC